MTNPVFLSQLADSLREEIAKKNNGERFDGALGVSMLSKITRVRDKNVILSIGQSMLGILFSLDQNVFNGIEENVFRDSVSNIYTFNDESKASGILPFLSDCYSPTCSLSDPCYSALCPNKIERDVVLALPRLKSSIARESNAELWSSTVSPEILQSIKGTPEFHRQEVIFEIISKEKEFCDDLDNFIKVLWLN